LDAEAKDGTRTVYSGEIVSDNPEILPVSDKVPIIKLAKNQKLKLEAYARLAEARPTQSGSQFPCVPTSTTPKS
jgi:hypothetical protein